MVYSDARFRKAMAWISSALVSRPSQFWCVDPCLKQCTFERPTWEENFISAGIQRYYNFYFCWKEGIFLIKTCQRFDKNHGVYIRIDQCWVDGSLILMEGPKSNNWTYSKQEFRRLKKGFVDKSVSLKFLKCLQKVKITLSWRGSHNLSLFSSKRKFCQRLYKLRY